MSLVNIWAMRSRSDLPGTLRADLVVLIVLALARLVFHVLTNGAYGFHRDELAVLDDARRLAWGYVAYPPFTPFVGRIALELFGLSMTGVRLFGALAQCTIMVLAGLMARAMGGNRHAQILAAVAAAIAPMSMMMTSLFQYITFDALWWVAVAFFMVKLMSSDDPRWWLGVGAAIGLGMMTKYTMAYWTVGVVVAVLLTPLRRHLRSPWLWAGVVLSLVIFIPNFVWQVKHDFISGEFLGSIHARDVRIGRTADFFKLQPLFAISIVTVPLALAGIGSFFFDRELRRFRALGWMFLTTLVLMVASQARFYYLVPAYPMLFAAGSVLTGRWLRSMGGGARAFATAAIWILMTAGAVFSAVTALPLAPVGSRLWNFTASLHDNFREQLGWHELVDEVARIYDGLPAEVQARTGIFTGNYGEAGAINLYGPEKGLPRAISGINSYWYLGYGDPAPTQLIVIGEDREDAEKVFRHCEIVGKNANRYGVENEESRDHPDILLCRDPMLSWAEIWRRSQHFG